MSLNLYDADLHVQRQKELARASAAAYDPAARRPRRGLRHTYRRALATAGGALITLGYRLQGEIEDLPVLDLAEPLALRRNGTPAG